MIKYDRFGRMQYNKELHFNQGKPWSKEDIEYLKKWCNIIGAEEMSLALGRTETTVSNKIYLLRKAGVISRDRSKYNPRLLRMEDKDTILF